MRPCVVFCFVLPFCLAGWLRAQVRAPEVGVARYSDGSVHRVYGVEDALVVDAEAIGAADAISFSDAGGLVSLQGHIRLIGPSFNVIAEYDSGEAAPLVNVDGDLTTAIAWLPERRALVRWNGKSFVSTELNSPFLARVTAVRVENAKEAKLLLAEAGGVVSEAAISLETGNLISLNVLAAIRAPAFWQKAFVVFHDEHGLEIASSSGAVRTLPVAAADLTVERMSSDWLHLASVSAKRDWVLHLNERTVELSELPAAPKALASPIAPAQEVPR